MNKTKALTPEQQSQLDDIATSVQNATGVTLSALKSKSRLYGIVDARAIFVRIAYETTQLNGSQILRFIEKAPSQARRYFRIYNARHTTSPAFREKARAARKYYAVIERANYEQQQNQNHHPK